MKNAKTDSQVGVDQESNDSNEGGGEENEKRPAKADEK